jgi:membrane protease YdiL (CAAX protease family)
LTLRSFFLGADGRLHAPWRIVVFLLIAALCTQVVAIAALPLLRNMDAVVGMQGTAESLVIVMGLLAAHALMLYAIDRRTWSDVGLDAHASRAKVMGEGWLLGALPILLPSLLLLLTGWLALRPALQGSWWLAAAQLSFFLLPAALYEELMSRGYIFAALREWLGWPVALGLTSLGFGLLHLANPGANAQSVIMVTLAGVFLGAVLLVTGSLFAAWMAHWAWNWVMAVLLHAAVSGVPMPRPDYQTVDAGPDWITGGPWGPEGGAGAAAGMLAGLAYLYMKRPRIRDDQR